MAVEEEMTEEESEEEEDSEKGTGKKLFLIIIIAAVLLGGAGAAYYFLLRGDKDRQVTKQSPNEGGEGEEVAMGEEREEGEVTKSPPKMNEGIIFPMEHFIVNVNDVNGATRYLKIEIKLELENAKMKAEVENRVPKIRDSIVTILTNKSVEDISDSNGKIRLKEEIKARINSFLTLGRIVEVYFTDFIIQ